MSEHTEDISKSLEAWIWEHGRYREYREGESHVLEFVESTNLQVDESAEKTLFVRFDPKKTDIDQFIKLLVALSELYKSLGGDGLIIRDGLAFVGNPEDELVS